MTQKIVTNLWFDGQALEAAELYCSLFPDSAVLSVARYPEGAPGEPGTVMTVEWQLAGQRFTGINGGPQFPHTEAMSLMVACADQAEVDHYWDGLLAGGGQESQCGWLKDRFGVSWQVVPDGMAEVFGDPDPARAQRGVQAMLGMRKIDVAALRAAADG